MNFPLRAVFGTLLGLLAAACSLPDERAIETPVTRTFHWFRYVGGDEVRAACGQDGQNRIRAVYNALWEEQVRTYDISLARDGTAAMTVRVISGQGAVSTIEISDAGDLTGPWNAKVGQRVLAQEDTSQLLALMQQANAFGPPRAGQRLPDNDFWWTVASCRNGVWGFQAYHFPTDGFANTRFAEKLFSLDPVAVPVNRARRLEPSELRYDVIKGPQRGRADRWQLMVGRDGLAGR
jgi:hypothetical protein